MASVVTKDFNANEISPNQHLWGQFWKNVSCRKKYFDVLDAMKREQCLVSRQWFFTCCRRLGLVPKTLEVKNKPHKNIADDLDRQWAQVVEKGERDFLLIARSHVERELASARSVVRREITELEESVNNEDIWTMVDAKLSREGIRTLKEAGNNHRQRLRDLLVKEGKHVPRKLNESAKSTIESPSVVCLDSFLDQQESVSQSTPVRPQRAARAAVPPTDPTSPIHPRRSPPPDLSRRPVVPQPGTLPAGSCLAASRVIPRPAVPQPGVRVNFAELDRWVQYQRSQAVESNSSQAPPPPAGRSLNNSTSSTSSREANNGRRRRIFIPRPRYRNGHRKESRKKIGNLVTNYSTFELTEAQKRVLNLGLNFCPRRDKVNKTEVVAACNRWERNMRWTEFWHRQQQEEGVEGSETDDVEADQPDRVFPDKEIKTNLPRGHNARAALNECIAATKFDILGAPLKRSQPNMSPEMKAAQKDLITLQREREIVIKPSDKTGGVCVLPFKAYKESMDSKLRETFVASDGTVKPKYLKASQKDLQAQHKQIKALVKEGVERGFINPEDAEVMVPGEPTAGRLYGLVKDHKPVNPDTGIPPLREVVSGSGSNTEMISAFVDIHAKKQVTKQETYLEDTPDVLRMFEEMNSGGPLPAGAIPVVYDVVALYPSIPHEGGLEALRLSLEADPDISDELAAYLVRLMWLVLTCNIFEWDGGVYIQQDGCAIGTRAAPTYAGAYMGRFLKEAMIEWENVRVKSQVVDNVPKKSKIFIDDGLFFWQGGEIELRRFLDFLNTRDPAIKITWEFDFQKKEVNFLDLRIWVDEAGFVQTDLYRKPNSKNNYLLSSSCHPEHIFKNIPYSLAHRIVRICSRQEDCRKNFGELRKLLLVRGYNSRVVDAAIVRAETLERSEALKKVVRDRVDAKRTKFIIPYDPRLPDLAKILKKNWQVMISEDQRLRSAFESPPMLCFQRPKNLKDILCRARLPPERAIRPPRPGFRRCQKGRCHLCPHSGIGPGEIITHVRIHHSGEEIEIKSPISCQTCGVLYVITCDKTDKKQYLGQTKRSAAQRGLDHLNSIRNNNSTNAPVGLHFRGDGHSHADLIMTPFEKIFNRDPHVRLAREREFINKYGLIEHGLNRNL